MFFHSNTHLSQVLHFVLELGKNIKLKGGGSLVGRNMYADEGLTWDLEIPTATVKEPLLGIITGDREISSAHLPRWYS